MLADRAAVAKYRQIAMAMLIEMLVPPIVMSVESKEWIVEVSFVLIPDGRI